MALTAAEKMRRLRARQRDGEYVLPMKVNRALAEDVLIPRGYLSEEDADDREKVADALLAAVSQLITPPAEPDDVTGNDHAFRFVR